MYSTYGVKLLFLSLSLTLFMLSKWKKENEKEGIVCIYIYVCMIDGEIAPRTKGDFYPSLRLLLLTNTFTKRTTYDELLLPLLATSFIDLHLAPRYIDR